MLPRKLRPLFFAQHQELGIFVLLVAEMMGTLHQDMHTVYSDYSNHKQTDRAHLNNVKRGRGLTAHSYGLNRKCNILTETKHFIKL